MTALIKQSTTAVNLRFLLVLTSDHITGATGLTPTVTISKNAAGYAAPSGAVTEIGNGWYKIAGNATDTNTLGPIDIHATGTGADPSDTMDAGFVVAFDPQDATALGLSRIDAAVSSRMATYTQPTGFLAATFPTSVASPTNITAGTITTVTTVTNQLTAAQIATGVWQDATAGDFTTAGSIGKSLYTTGNAPGAASGLALVGSNMGTVSSVTGAVGSVTGAVGSVTGAVGSVTGAVGSIASGGITRASLAADTGLQSIRSNTAQAGAATSITLDASASATNSFYNNCLILITGGTGVGQARFITAYVGATKVATVATWGTNPDATSTFAILPFDAVAGASAPTAAQVATAVWTDLMASSDFSTASSIGALLKTDIDAAISSRMATYTQPTGFLAATFPSGTVASTTNITAGTIATVTNLTNAPTAGDFTATMKTSLNAATPVATVSGDFSATMKTSLNAATPVASLSGDFTTTMKTSLTTAATAATPTVLLTPGTATGQVSLTAGVVAVDLKKINGTTVNGNGGVTPWGP